MAVLLWECTYFSFFPILYRLYRLYSEDIINIIKRFAIIPGYLSRTGLCVNPAENFKIKDPRLNFWGVAYVLPDDANPKCTESECSEDSHCDADRKCCKNYCGGMVCTPTST